MPVVCLPSRHGSQTGVQALARAPALRGMRVLQVRCVAVNAGLRRSRSWVRATGLSSWGLASPECCGATCSSGSNPAPQSPHSGQRCRTDRWVCWPVPPLRFRSALRQSLGRGRGRAFCACWTDQSRRVPSGSRPLEPTQFSGGVLRLVEDTVRAGRTNRIPAGRRQPGV